MDINYYPTVYADDSIILTYCDASQCIHVYIKTIYHTPYKGVLKIDWLHEKEWKIKENRYYERDGIGRFTGNIANNYKEIVNYIKTKERK